LSEFKKGWIKLDVAQLINYQRGQSYKPGTTFRPKTKWLAHFLQKFDLYFPETISKYLFLTDLLEKSQKMIYKLKKILRSY